MKLLQQARSADVMRATARVLKSQRRIAEADLLIRDLGAERLVSARHLEANIISARALTKTSKQRLTQWLKTYYQAATINESYATDANLVGGVVITTPRHDFKFSVADRLEKL